MTQKIDFKIVLHNSKEYWKTVALRDKLLRKPLGLEFSKEELEAEINQIHIAGFLNDKAVASLSLIVLNKHLLKMRQVCTDNELQGHGIGKQLAKFTEQWAINNNYNKIECNARKVAVPFYQSMGYKIVSNLFYEVGIEHYKMEKELY